MKNRDYKNFASESYYHVFNRGNGKQTVFFDAEDYKLFILRLRENLFPLVSPEGRPQGGASLIAESHTPYIRKPLPPESFHLLSYCLMPNHFHFLVKQNTDLPVGKLIAKVCTSYSMYVNKKYDKVGNLFQGTFKAALVDSDAYLLWVSAYIHNNPRTAGLVESSQDWSYSSYADYLGLRSGTLCDQSLILGMMNEDRSQYKKFVEDAYKKIRERKDLGNLLLD